jgi:hypothetical protein
LADPKLNNMKKIFFFLLAASLTTTLSAQTEAEMKAWQEYMTPGEVHKMLQKSEGTWNGEITMWMAPGQEPTKSKGTAKNEMILGGRYLQGVNKGDFMGMPMEGISLTAYDNAKKKFYSTWIDNFGTGIMTMEGTWDAKKKAIHFKGTMTDPMTGKDVKVRETFTFIDDNTQFMEMWMESNGKEFKSMEIKYTKG